MNTDHRETLVGRVLARHEETIGSPPRSNHAHDDTLALFAEGRLSAPEMNELVEHLADCGECRTKAGLLLIAAGEDPEAELVRPATLKLAWYRRPAAQLLALAAAVLLCLTSFLLLSRPQGPVIALAGPGKLTEFGAGIGGVAARDPVISSADAERTQERLDALPQGDPHVQFNRGYLLLQQNRLGDAITEFQKLVDERPTDPLGHLGLGSAKYLSQDYRGAAKSFEEALRLQPDLVAARMNLAMTYEELGDEQGLALWKRILAEDSAQLSPDERRQIEAQIRVLEGSQ